MVKTQGFCDQVPICIQGEEFSIQFYVLPLGGCDIVLGTQWLTTLGDIQWNFQFLTMEFCHKGHKVLLQGMKQFGSHLLNGDQFFRLQSRKAFWFISQLRPQPKGELPYLQKIYVENLLRFLTLQQGYLLLGGINITLLFRNELNQSAKGHTSTLFSKKMRQKRQLRNYWLLDL